ncbi:DnaD domain-containing protein [uncultured Catenibacterium sp.]|uniref:DnaD domain-containing protein n=1 Tax=uncultured Catenibacterium sp. TaxID=286142 RepID=UPI0025972D18|nr:DnaD domain protein [uncultured Catenibacterium sp.]
MSTQILTDYQCIDYKKLLLLKGKSIGLTDQETHILLLMMTLNELGVRPIYPQKVAEFSSLSIKDIDDIMIGLVDRHYLDRINLRIDFKPLEKLLLGIKVEKKEEVNLVEVFEDAFGRTMSTLDIEYINQFKRTGYDDEMIVSALKEAVKSNALSFRYVERVLENWAHSKNYIKKYQEEEPEVSEEVRNYNWWEND